MVGKPTDVDNWTTIILGGGGSGAAFAATAAATPAIALAATCGIRLGSGGGVIGTAGDAYRTWFDGFFSGSADPGVSDFTADPDHDGVPNGIEFVLGGKPKDETSSAKLPPISVDASTITFIFRRTAAAAFLNPRVETVVDPTGRWTPAVNGVDGVVIADEPNGFETGVDRVTVVIPRG